MRMDTRVCLNLDLLAALENAFCSAAHNKFPTPKPKVAHLTNYQNYLKYQKSGFAGVCGFLRVFCGAFWAQKTGRWQPKADLGIQALGTRP